MAGKAYVDGHKLKQWMAIRGVNQRELAQQSQLHENTISGMVNSGSVRLGSVVAVANALSIHPLDVLSFDGFPSPHVAAQTVAVNGLQFITT